MARMDSANFGRNLARQVDTAVGPIGNAVARRAAGVRERLGGERAEILAADAAQALVPAPNRPI